MALFHLEALDSNSYFAEVLSLFDGKTRIWGLF